MLSAPVAAATVPSVPVTATTVLTNARASLVAQKLKHLPAMRESQVQSVGWEDPLEKEIANHSSILV